MFPGFFWFFLFELDKKTPFSEDFVKACDAKWSFSITKMNQVMCSHQKSENFLCSVIKWENKTIIRTPVILIAKNTYPSGFCKMSKSILKVTLSLEKMKHSRQQKVFPNTKKGSHALNGRVALYFLPSQRVDLTRYISSTIKLRNFRCESHGPKSIFSGISFRRKFDDFKRCQWQFSKSFFWIGVYKTGL